MYTLFTANATRSYGGTLRPPGFHDVEKKIVEAVETIRDYYRRSSIWVKPEHLLCKLINTMSVPLHYDLEDYFEVATMKALQVATSLRMTSSISAGEWKEGIFYRGCSEILIAYTQWDTPKELVKTWYQLQPVSVLDCPISNLKYMLPDGLVSNTERGPCVIAIDIPKLMLMYRCFTQWCRAVGEDLGTHHFVARYVLPNMLLSQTDIAILNRLINMHYGAPMGSSVKKHPFYITDYSDRLDKVLEDVLARVTQTNLEFPNILKQIPRVFSPIPYQMPDMAETVQVWWALFYARMKLMDFLWEISTDTGRQRNKMYVNDLIIDIKRFRSDQVFKRRLDSEQQLDLQLLFDKYLREIRI